MEIENARRVTLAQTGAHARLGAGEMDALTLRVWRRASSDPMIEWPELRARVVMTAEAPLDCLVVYTPVGRSFLCVEPVSHVTDAFNLAEAGVKDTGMKILAPGETLRAAISLTPEPGA